MQAYLPKSMGDGRQAASWTAAIVLISFPTVGMLSKHGMSSLGFAMAFLLCSLVLWNKRLPWPGLPLVLPAIFMLALQALNLLEVPSCSIPTEHWCQIAASFVLLLPLSAGEMMMTTTGIDRNLVRRALVNGVMIGAIVAIVELVFDSPIHRLFEGNDSNEIISLSRYNRGIVDLLLLAIVAAGILWIELRRLMAIGLLAMIALISMLGISLTVHLCLLLGLITLFGSILADKLVRTVLVVLVAVQMLTAPWAANAVYDWVLLDNIHIKDMAIRHRLELWDHGAALALQRPWTGWGIDAFYRQPIDPVRLAKAELMTKTEPHPHNAGLQLWIETGGVGVLLGIAFLVAANCSIGQLPIRVRPWATSLLAIGLLPGMVSFGIWQATYLAMTSVASFSLGLLDDQ
ncbi:O-Antigen Polymerase family protein [Candidatus Endolissoclinum faulkneri L5]|uniref:O-Antigen Polymerase family protein n=1 Tax=Candidatus Endolissoclinum faulkneri L5 TaxID=1401328 RepID=V9TUW5_9PROT|nr:O-antigen ligase family protein [Candidatus Endolissoclinum faulkneri]AHC73488.1 O-Antigen Polymerase family protein [Candidatus Endolissoclinum faulkneri L5]